MFGGIIFATLGGTPHIVLLATAPLALYTQSKSDFVDLGRSSCDIDSV